MAYTTPASSILQTPCKIEEIEMKNQRSARATSNGASSSSTAADSNNSSSNIPLFDVFINHRGEVKKNFSNHLYRALLLRGLRPFLDQQDLQEGLPFPSQLEAVISNASVHVAIFSPKYAESRWCLDELVLMLQSGAPIIPVFYHVNPADLRWTAHNKTGVYAISLHELELKKTFDAGTQQEKLRYDPATIQKWRDALSSVADINGFDLNGKFNGDEVHMIDKIVERVGEMIRKPGLYVAKHPTGLDDKVTDFEATVFKQQHGGEIQVAGIVGLGGMGKTTLALELFNRMSSKYNKSFFLSDVREKANKNSLHSVQRELLRALTQKDLDINNIHESIGMFERHLKSAHVLIILDDIDHEDQLEALLPVKNVFRLDSFILITSRYKDVLERSGVEHFYQLRGLSKEHSQQLFCSYSFCQTYPFHEFEDLVDRFLEVCDGMPLALKVLGALLFKKDKFYWKAKLDELTVHKKVPTDIKNRLKISYEALSEEEQKIFLDIASFFIGEKRTSAIAVWDASGWNGLLGLTNLEGKCLIEVDDKNVIHMHDQLRDLGRHIAEEEMPRRLWRRTRNSDDLLTINVLTEARGIMMLPQGRRVETSSQMLSCYQWGSQQLLGNFLMQRICNSLYNIHYFFLGFDVMNLQLVETEGHMLDRILRVPSPNLIWLSWRHCPYTSLPSWITIKNLRVLRVEGGVLETLWQSKSQAPLQLQELEIINASCLWSIPKSIEQLKHLERIVVLNAGPLKSLPDSLSKLTNLHSLDLKSCKKLERLPDSFGSLTNLHSLDLGWCKKLEGLPDSFGSLTNLHSLDLKSCEKLEGLPDSFGSLTNLHSLDLESCEKLEGLPDSFGSLTNLHSLDLKFCEKLERLPDSFGSLTNLHSLDLNFCKKLEGLPDSFGTLTNLHSLDLKFCKKLEGLPDSFGSLTNLHSLDLGSCDKLEGLPDSFGSLTNLHSLDLRWCEKLERLPDSFGSLTNLHSLDLGSCKKLEGLPDSFGSLTNLHRLDLGSCQKLEGLPDSFGSLTNLHRLDLGSCEKLEGLPDSFGSLTNLHRLDLGLCKKLEGLPDSFGSLTNLHSLDLKLCEKLEGLPDSFGSLTNLHSLDLGWCKKLERLPDSFSSLTNLHSVDLKSCKKLERLPDSFGSLTNLHRLHLRCCSQLERLPDSLESLTALKHFDASSCASLRISSETFGNIRTLERIDLSGCGKVEVFPWQLAHQRSLKTLKLIGTNFKEMPSAIELPRDLEVLWIGNPLLDRVMPSLLGDLLNLKELHLEYRGELKCLSTSVERSSELSWLKVAGCPITHTSEVFYEDNVVYPKLEKLILEDCFDLAEVGTLPKALTEVTLIGCDNLRSIEGLCGLAMLRKLHIEKCKELEELPSVKTMVSLEQLDAIDCVNLKSIRDLRWLTKLKYLNVHRCPELGELEGVADCTSLKWFTVTRCPKLRLDESSREAAPERYKPLSPEELNPS